MKIGVIEISGVERVVDNQRVVWERYRDRWVKYVKGEARTGMSNEEMHRFLNLRAYDPKYRVWSHNETINITKEK